MLKAMKPPPHPLLTQSVLYVARAPLHVQRSDLETVFKRCGRIVSLAKLSTQGAYSTWKVEYQDLWTAEMALATLHEAVLESVEPRWTLQLSHNKNLDSPLPQESKRVLPQYLQCTAMHPLQTQNAQALYALFRIVGPLVSVRAHVDVGDPHKLRTCIVEYWELEHASNAQSDVVLPTNKGLVCPAILQPFDPYDIYCYNLDASVTEDMLRTHFSELQSAIISVRVRKASNTKFKIGFITFATKQEAARALTQLNLTTLAARTIHLQYSIKKDLKPPPQPQRAARNSAQHEMSSEKAERASDQKAHVDLEKHVQEEDERKRVMRKRLQAATQKRMWAEQEEKKAYTTLQEIESQEAELQTQLKAEQISYNVIKTGCDLKEAELLAAQKAREEAERVEATLRREHEGLKSVLTGYPAKLEQTTNQITQIVKRKESATKVGKEATEYMQAAVEEEEHLAQEMHALCITREEEIAESIRKLRELAEIEQAEKQKEEERKANEAEEKRKEEVRLAKEAEERRLEAERQAKAAKEQQEQERLAREKESQAREREEQERARENAQRRLRQYEDAAAVERDRCRFRDLALFPTHARMFWSAWRALERFRAVSEEFDIVKFSDEQPLTLDSVPWPLLCYPDDLTTDTIEWNAVEAFFTAIKQGISVDEYKSLVERTHRRFHPDKWKSRRLLATIADEDLREKVEAAGNTVAQALTPLWLASKSM